MTMHFLFACQYLLILLRSQEDLPENIGPTISSIRPELFKSVIGYITKNVFNNDTSYIEVNLINIFFLKNLNFIIYIMTVLFILSNIAIPFIVLSYASLARVHQNGSFYSAKWLCLIIYTLLSNILFYFMSTYKIFLLVDLILKLGIIFMPGVFNQRLEKMIRIFHLQTYINISRSLIISQFFTIDTFIKRIVMGWMSEEEKKMFKNAIINSLQRKTPVSQTPSFIKENKKFENRGVSCEIITTSMINDERMQKQLYRLQLSHSKIDSNKDLNHYGSAGNFKKEGLHSSRLQPLQQKINVMKKKPTFMLQKSSTDIGLYDQEERMSFPKEENEQIKNKNKSRAKSPQIRSSRASKKQQEPSMILNKLDVSQYSDMFEDEQAEKDGKKILAKVETIIEISGVNSPRLQIYNIQLYSNSQIRIISLYGRQFQRHRLISMKPLKHGYYEMKVEGGKVNSRKVKFRGSFEPFLKYLEPEI